VGGDVSVIDTLIFPVPMEDTEQLDMLVGLTYTVTGVLTIAEFPAEFKAYTEIK
jgi:hypothetical protein